LRDFQQRLSSQAEQPLLPNSIFGGSKVEKGDSSEASQQTSEFSAAPTYVKK